jgi:hypothetical protein
MPLYGIPRRAFRPEAGEPTPINWRRDMFRVWLLMSAGRVMSWVIYLLTHTLEGRFPGSDFLVVPILLFDPPVTLPIFGVTTGWAFRGFHVEDDSPKECGHRENSRHGFWRE